MELPLDTIQRAKGLVARHRCPHDLATPYALQSSLAHQPLHRAPGCPDAFSPKLLPDLHRAIALHVGIPHALDFRDQCVVTPCTARAQCRVTKSGRVPAVTGRGDLQDAADRLDPETVTMLIDKCPQDLVRRSSSAWAKYALARRRISLALRSSRFSRSRALMRSRSSVVGPGRWPASV
ncbi:hypothetical protein FQZ97_779750 [compost metagenome]